MTVNKNRQTDAINLITSTFKLFENKLDKLQNDLYYQGQTLSDLRELILNLSSGTIVSPDTKGDVHTRPHKSLSQYDGNLLNTKDAKNDSKIKKKIAPVPPPPEKNNVKSIHSQKRFSDIHGETSKVEASLHMQRHRKAEAIRQAAAKRAAEKRRKKLAYKLKI